MGYGKNVKKIKWTCESPSIEKMMNEQKKAHALKNEKKR
jgi:hypothetical protein